MIINYEKPVYNPKSDTWEIKIKVKGQNEIYTQIVETETEKAAQEYIRYVDLAIKQREQNTR
ncbi:MAG: hypothetical protein II670_02060 [Alphaproteobacteria bacterium]|nr:hypothetical protein [Alphaproteobacteria bacterium]